jgi:hypothetical protein
LIKDILTTIVVVLCILASSKLTTANETVYGIWNTTAGHNSSPSSSGSSVGDYYPVHSPDNVFDNIYTDKYLNYGVCNSTVGGTTLVCGWNTGLYVSPQGGALLLCAFRVCTADSYPQRDPIYLTIEGSNQPLSTLTLGSSWIIIYNGSSGLDVDPGRSTCGVAQWLSNNSIWYASYRILVTSKRAVGNFVQYSELELFGY